MSAFQSFSFLPVIVSRSLGYRAREDEEPRDENENEDDDE